MVKTTGEFLIKNAVEVGENARLKFDTINTSNDCIEYKNGKITLKAKGLYQVSGTFVLQAPSADIYQVALKTNGIKTLTKQNIPCEDYATLNFTTLVAVKETTDPCNFATMTVINSTEVIVEFADLTVEKIA